jgi:CRISPR/Cas system-associated exonuclease Cas4 (RecB family)
MFIAVPVSKFAECMGYCQLQIINYFHLGIKPRITEAARAGSELHQKLEKLDRLIPRVKATGEELADPQVDLDIPRESLRVKILRSNKNIFAYFGRIDKAVRKNGDVYIIDDRVSRIIRSEPFQSKILQLSGYCEGFSRNYAGLLKFRDIIFQIVQRDLDGNVISNYVQKYDRKRKRFLLENFKNFERIYNREIPPEHCNSAAKCSACSYDCDFRL